jgi:hypothetical protein
MQTLTQAESFLVAADQIGVRNLNKAEFRLARAAWRYARKVHRNPEGEPIGGGIINDTYQLNYAGIDPRSAELKGRIFALSSASDPWAVISCG